MTNKTDFITLLLIKINKLIKQTFTYKQPEKLSGCLYALFACSLMLLMPAAAAENINPLRSEARIMQNGQLSISTRFQTTLPEQLEDALKQGVSLDFALSYQLERPTFAAYRLKLSQLVNNQNTVNYRLSFHPLTNRYRVSVGTFSTEYNSLQTALRAVGAIANWPVLAEGTLEGSSPDQVQAKIRLNLSTAKLPKPFQINALNSSNWDLDSGWQPLNIR